MCKTLSVSQELFYLLRTWYQLVITERSDLISLWQLSEVSWRHLVGCVSTTKDIIFFKNNGCIWCYFRALLSSNMKTAKVKKNSEQADIVRVKQPSLAERQYSEPAASVDHVDGGGFSRSQSTPQTRSDDENFNPDILPDGTCISPQKVAPRNQDTSHSAVRDAEVSPDGSRSFQKTRPCPQCSAHRSVYIDPGDMILLVCVCICSGSCHRGGVSAVWVWLKKCHPHWGNKTTNYSSQMRNGHTWMINRSGITTKKGTKHTSNVSVFHLRDFVDTPK